MYNKFFGLDKNPFNMTPDPAFLFLTAQHREALAGLWYAVLEKKGFLVLTGDAGTGKTTLVSKVLQNFPPELVRPILILNPSLSPAEFLEMTLLDAGMQKVPESKAQRLASFHSILLEGHQAGTATALFVDEAHKLSLELLEEIRLLGNFEYADEKLLQILLVGQDELNTLLERDDLRQFKQRIALRISIGRLSQAETGQYIEYRWTKAGGMSKPPFTPDAIASVYACSSGIPRVINVLCDNALMIAYGEGHESVTLASVTSAARDLYLIGHGHPVPVIPAYRPVPVEKDSELLHLEPIHMKTLERYGSESEQSSLLRRWAGKLGLFHRVTEV
jgi:general secretion pathway protein A